MDIESLLRLLNERDARYVVIGAMAFPRHGYARPTADVDLLVDPTEENVRRVREALGAFGYDVTDASVEEMRTMKILFRQHAVESDIHPHVKGATWDEVWGRRQTGEIRGVPVFFASLGDLIRMKQAAGRPKDLLDLNVLHRLRERKAIERIDAANGGDPNREVAGGKARPKELLYSERMSGWLKRLAPGASEALRLAVRAQHIRRWEIPRGRYPAGKAGYHEWRTFLYGFHAEAAGKILREAGYDEATISRVGQLIRKENLKTDPEAQALEDAAALVFLESYFAEFSKQHDEAKLVTILRKTWRKMSKAGRGAALALPFPPALGRIVAQAVEGPKRGGGPAG